MTSQGDTPLFVYGHFKEAHAPYAGSGSTKYEKYLSALSRIDAELGRLLDTMDESTFSGRAALFVTGDHGEAFGEHGQKEHGTTVYDELLRVPLLVRLPGASPGREARLVSLIDLGPTILDLFGVATPGNYMGQSLVGYLAGKPEMLSRPLVIDTGVLKRAMVFSDGLKVIFDRKLATLELYDLNRDPGELDSLVDDRPELADARLAVLQAFFDAHELRRRGYETPYRP
jgi:arylsulfatase A-like enzyme